MPGIKKWIQEFELVDKWAQKKKQVLSITARMTDSLRGQNAEVFFQSVTANLRSPSLRSATPKKPNDSTQFADEAKEHIYHLPISNFYQSKTKQFTQPSMAMERNSGKMKS